MRCEAERATDGIQCEFPAQYLVALDHAGRAYAVCGTHHRSWQTRSWGGLSSIRIPLAELAVRWAAQKRPDHRWFQRQRRSGAVCHAQTPKTRFRAAVRSAHDELGVVLGRSREQDLQTALRGVDRTREGCTRC